MKINRNYLNFIIGLGTLTAVTASWVLTLFILERLIL